MSGSHISSWVFHEVTHYGLNENAKSFSGDDFTIKNGQGQVVIKADGKVFAFGDNIKLHDTNGQELSHITKEHMHTHKTYAIKNQSGNTVATVQKKHHMGNEEIVVYRGTDTDGEILLKFNGHMMHKNFTVHNAQGHEIAKSHDKTFHLTALMGKDDYVLEVQPNHDVILIISALLAIDCMNE